jgi:hypothetical protein
MWNFIFILLWKCIKKIQIWLKLGKRSGNLHEDISIFNCFRQHYISIRASCSVQMVSGCSSVHPSVRPSICPHVSVRLPLDGFTWNLTSGTHKNLLNNLQIWLKLIWYKFDKIYILLLSATLNLHESASIGVIACTNMYKHVQACASMYKHVQTCTSVYNHVQTCTSMYKHYANALQYYVTRLLGNEWTYFSFSFFFLLLFDSHISLCVFFPAITEKVETNHTTPLHPCDPLVKYFSRRNPVSEAGRCPKHKTNLLQCMILKRHADQRANKQPIN